MTQLAVYRISVSITIQNVDVSFTATLLPDNQVAIDIASDYACEDADITFQLFDLFNDKLKDDANNAKLLHQLEIPTAQILCAMEADGILIKRSFLNELSKRFDEEIIALEARAHDIAGDTFNVGSPKQLGEVLFDKLGVVGGKNINQVLDMTVEDAHDYFDKIPAIARKLKTLMDVGLSEAVTSKPPSVSGASSAAELTQISSPPIQPTCARQSCSAAERRSGAKSVAPVVVRLETIST